MELLKIISEIIKWEGQYFQKVVLNVQPSLSEKFINFESLQHNTNIFENGQKGYLGHNYANLTCLSLMDLNE